jgi:dTDP-4-dehydrorhamnose reductase
MNVLVLGSGGQVAQCLARAAPRKINISVAPRTQVDICNAKQVAAAFASLRPRWVINCAAYTAVDRAENETEQARLANDVAPGTLAEIAAASGCRLLHLSTDFVFDGKTNRAYSIADVPRPLSVYGCTKLRGEGRVLRDEANNIVLRTAWVYAAQGRNFVLTMLRLMRELPEVRVVCDQIGAPTWAAGLAEAIWALLLKDAPSGLYHWTDLGIASWYDFAVAIHDEAIVRGLLRRSVAVTPIQTAEYPTPAVRPAFSVLDTKSTRVAASLSGHHWRHNLGKMLHELQAA